MDFEATLMLSHLAPFALGTQVPGTGAGKLPQDALAAAMLVVSLLQFHQKE